jgi:16S rRNA (adenine1518-N6/adenine1519-N6)-dimethyltransferase
VTAVDGLLGAADVRALAAELGLRPAKSLGQNFVHDANTVRRIVRTAQVSPSDVVVEIGPGLGSLTLGLLPAAARVVAVEVDARLAATLPATVAARLPAFAERLEVVAADALRLDSLPGPPPTALVANLPYNVAVPVLLHVLERLPTLRHGLVMVQAEVADRLTAEPGSRSYGAPSVKAAWYAGLRRAGVVPRPVFWPVPNVDSGLVRFVRRDPPAAPEARLAVFAVVDAAFGQRRKSLRAALAGWAGSPAAAEAALVAAGVDPLARGPPGERRSLASLAVVANREEDVLGANVRVLPTAREAVTVRVPAKVNLFLRCGPVRSDGYHDVSTVYHAISLVDEVTVSSGTGLSVSVVGDGAADVPAGADNLAARAAIALGRRAGVHPAVHIAISKGIPVSGGMAGGSADAAATLVACDTLWGTQFDREALHEVAAGLGSDVPFALHGGTALGTGRGDRLTSVLARGDYHWVVAIADGGLATPAVYAELDRQRSVAAVPVVEPSADAVLTALRSGDPVALGRALHNDLQHAALALRPSLTRTLEAGFDLGALGAVVSGSGPTCVFLVADDAAAVEMAAALSGAGVCRAVRRASGPVTGARVVDTA